MRLVVRIGVVGLLLFVALPARGTAQCSSGGSSCVTCHESRAQHPALDDGRAWHRDHAFGDLCVACHGGDRAAADADTAHASMGDALALARCASCHEDAERRREPYVAARETPRVPPSASVTPAGPPPARSIDHLLTIAIALLGVALGLLVISRREGLALALARAWRAPRWTPEVAGALLGVAVATSYVLRDRPLGISGAIDSDVGALAHALWPSATYWRDVIPVGIDERSLVVVGVLFGSLLSSAFSGTLRLRWLPERGWTERFGPSARRRMALAFVGATLVQFGAGIAGGCTSGLAISGGALLSPAAFVFVAGMFAGGIPVALVAARRGAR